MFSERVALEENKRVLEKLKRNVRFEAERLTSFRKSGNIKLKNLSDYLSGNTFKTFEIGYEECLKRDILKMGEFFIENKYTQRKHFIDIAFKLNIALYTELIGGFKEERRKELIEFFSNKLRRKRF